MNKYVLFKILICVSFIWLAAFPAFADFFNSNLLMGRIDQINGDKSLEGDTAKIPGEQSEKEQPHGLLPPKDYTKPQVTLTDSIDINTNRIILMKNIKGLKTEPYSVMPVDRYLAKNLESDFNKQWKNTKKRVQAWSEISAERRGGITDLDFVIPGSKSLERFVGGETRINIDGRQKITFSGRSEWTEGQIETSVSKNSSFPSLTMKQEPQFRIIGDVGRIHVDIKQDPQTGQFSNLEENINIKYNGEDRDIIKYIEAGNTSLSLEGATFAGYRGTHKGLFGIRGEGQLGPLKFTTIASQEKSESNVKSFRGKAEESTNQIRDYDYKANTYFFLDYKYREQFAKARDSFDRIYYNPADSLVMFEVYEDDSNVGNNLIEGTFALRGQALPMDMSLGTENPDAAVDGYYHKLDPTKDYYVDRSLGFIQFNRRVADESTIGVFMKTKSGQEYGSLNYDPNDVNSKIKLKLIKRKKQLPTNTDTWDLEWKNVYDLGQKQIDADGLEIRIYREATDGVSRDTQDGVPYTHILGLDKSDELGNPNPDNKIDLNRGFVNFFRGELIFPLLEPFNSDGPPAGVSVELNEKVPKIYNSQNREEKVEASKYYIGVKTANRQSVIQVGGMGGIMEGTDQVILNGKPLTRGKDYRIEYYSGRITLLSEEAMSPTADIDIRYEEPNAFQQMQKTLLGARGEFDLFSKSKIGAVMLFKNESTKERRVKLGQEPSQTLLFDTDAKFDFESRFLTRTIDALPFLTAGEVSTVRIETELATSMPTINTRGVVYIDDFEGSQNTPISIIRSNWTMASIPDISTTRDNVLQRGRLQWYNPWNRVKSVDIWPKKETSAGENTVHVLNLAYGKSEDVPMDKAFAGVMSSFYGSGLDMSRSRFIEVWARGAKGDLKIDIGSISEDFFPLDQPDGLLNTEDKPIPGQNLGDGILTKDEDTGLDGMFDSQEKAYYTKLGDTIRAIKDDPNSDNFNYKSGNKNDYTGINGTEGNASDGDRLGFPDTEDINRNGILDTRNSYYEYTISFDNPFDPYLVPDSVPAGDPHGWRLFRIPLWNNPNVVVGGSSPPDSTLIEFSRLWITNTDSTLIQIASIEIVESTWLEQGIEGGIKVNDTIRVTKANTHENREYFPPPGVKAEIDRETKIRKREQSLVLKVENLEPDNSAFVYRNFEKMNFTDYTSLNMYVHGPDNFPGESATESDVELILRFGGDKNNYYEYHTQIFSGWDRKNQVIIDFSKCTALKTLSGYGEFAAKPDSFPAVADTIGTKIYTIRGKPSLDNVKIISIGIKNNNPGNRLSGDIWVDELRMDTVRDMTGTAARINLNTNLAGFMNLTANATRKSSDFHDMNSKTGSGQDNTSWNTNATVNIDRFTPKRWNLHIPVSASITDTKALPRLMSGSDIILTDAQKTDYQSTSSDKKYRISFNKSQDPTLKGIKGTLVHWAFDKFNASYDWGSTDSSNPFSGTNYSDNRQIKAGYDVNPTEKKLKLLNWLPSLPVEMWEKFADMDFAYTPKQLNYSYTLDEKNQYKTNIDAVSDTTVNRTVSREYNFGYDPINALRYTYTRRTGNDLVLKQEVNFTENNRINLNGPTLLYVTNNYNYEIRYDEEDNPRYSISSQLGSKSIRMDKKFSINASFAWEKLFENISGKPNPPKVRFQRVKKETRKNWEDDKKPEQDSKIISKVDEKQAGEDKNIPKAENPPVKNADRPPQDDIKKEKTISGVVKEGDKSPQDEKKTVKPEEQKKPGTGLRTVMLMAVSKSLSPISFDYSRNEALNYAGIEDRPDFSVRFGRGTIQEPDSITIVSRQNSLNQTSSYSASTKINLPLDFGISLSGKIDNSEQRSPSVDSNTENMTPLDLKLNWTKVEDKIPYIKRFVSNIQLNSGYAVTNSKSWQNQSLTSDKISTRFSPLISLSAQVFKKLQTSFSLTTSSDGGSDFSGGTKSTSETTSNGIVSSFRYSLSSSKGLLFLKNLKLNSDINMTLNISTNSTETKRGIGNEPMARISSTDSWSLSPVVDYRFSSKFRGGMQMDFRNSVDMTKKVRKVREVSIWGELTF